MNIVLLISVLGLTMICLRLLPLLLIKYVSNVNQNIKFMLGMFAPAVISVIVFSEVFNGKYAHLNTLFLNPYMYGVIILLLLFRFVKNILAVIILGNLLFFMLANHVV